MNLKIIDEREARDIHISNDWNPGLAEWVVS
jgi:hypothetical protein